MIPGPLAQCRRAFILAHLGRYAEADGLLAPLTGPLAEGHRAAALLNRAVAEQDDDLIKQLTALPEFASQGEHHLEGQLLLDSARGQAWRERGDARQAKELLQSALRLAHALNMPTSFLESQLAGLTQEPMIRALALRGHLDAAIRGGDLRLTGVLAADMAHAYLDCLDLGGVTHAARYMLHGPLRSSYLAVSDYLRGDRGRPLPGEHGHPLFGLVRGLGALEQALLSQWLFDTPAACSAAQRTVALPPPLEVDAGLERHFGALLRARAWIILGDWPSAQAELAQTSRYRRLSLIGQLIGLEGALLLAPDAAAAWSTLALNSAAELRPEMLATVANFASRIAPTAVMQLADLTGGIWDEVGRARIQTVTAGLERLGHQAHRTPDEARRLGSYAAYLRSHHEKSVAFNSDL